METRKVLILFCLLSFPVIASAYEPETTHAGLTREIGILYNLQHENSKLSEAEIALMVQGSIDEDDDLRFLRHFYDPVHGSGLTFLSSANAGQPWPSAKEWSQSPDLQNPDRSWQFALSRYAVGDRKGALKALGHVLHLIEDMTVPDHTRDDPHPPYADTSPYEHFTAQFGSPTEGIGVADELAKLSVLKLESLDDYFENVAKFSNDNFFSKDTIDQKKFIGPLADYTEKDTNSEGIYAYRLILGKPFRLAKIEPFFDKKKMVLSLRYTLVDPKNLVMQDYWHLLSRKAVHAGAGVVELFFEEAEKLRVENVRSHLANDKQLENPIAEKSNSVFKVFADLVDPVLVAALPSNTPATKDEKRFAQPFSSIAGIGFSAPLFGDVHVAGNDTELGVPHIVSEPLVALAPEASTDPAISDTSEESDEVQAPAEPDSDQDAQEDPIPDEPTADEDLPPTILPLPQPTDTTAATLLTSSDLSSTKTITFDKSPYFAANDVRIPVGIVITLEPGVVIKMGHRASVIVEGELLAQGSADRPVVFTSRFDDEHGGNSNGDGVCVNRSGPPGTACPNRADWYRLEFKNGGKGTFAYAKVRFGGNDPFFVPQVGERNMLSVKNGEISIQDSLFEFSGTAGIRAESSKISIRNSRFFEIRQGVATCVNARDGELFLEGSTFNRCGVGLESFNSLSKISSNRFEINNLPIIIDGPFVELLSGNIGESNGQDAILLRRQIGQQGKILPLEKNAGLSFLVGGDSTIPVGGALTVQKGVVFKFDTSPLNLYGTLQVNGTENEPVIFTTSYDDFDGNDALNDGGILPPFGFVPAGLRLYPGSATSTQFLEFRKGVQAQVMP